MVRVVSNEGRIIEELTGVEGGKTAGLKLPLKLRTTRVEYNGLGIVKELPHLITKLGVMVYKL